MLLEATDDIAAFAGLPAGHWKKIWGTNPIERLNREAKRRADAVFLNPAALERLAGAVLAELHDDNTDFTPSNHPAELPGPASTPHQRT